MDRAVDLLMRLVVAIVAIVYAIKGVLWVLARLGCACGAEALRSEAARFALELLALAIIVAGALAWPLVLSLSLL